ncbi:MAG: hypothetical protein ABSG32_10440, partial [Terriglobia bacterium]
DAKMLRVASEEQSGELKHKSQIANWRPNVANLKSKIGNQKSKMLRWSGGSIITALQDVLETKWVSCLAPKCHKALSHSNQDI